MGYGLPAAIGVQIGAIATGSLIDIAGEASILMNIQEMVDGCAVTGLPVKIFILNNEYMGMVRQWQEPPAWRALLAELFGNRCPISSSSPKPTALSACVWRKSPAKLDAAIEEKCLHLSDRPVIFDCIVDKTENCFPDESRRARRITRCSLNGDYLSEEQAGYRGGGGTAIDDKGKMLV